MRGAIRHAAGGDWRVGVYFLFFPIRAYQFYVTYVTYSLNLSNCLQWNHMDRVT